MGKKAGPTVLDPASDRNSAYTTDEERVGTPVPETSGHPGSRHLQIRTLGGEASRHPGNRASRGTNQPQHQARTYPRRAYEFLRRDNERVPRYQAVRPKTPPHPRRACDIS